MQSAAFTELYRIFDEAGGELSGGEIAESGTHEELMEHHALYADLYTLQSGLYKKGV